MSDSPSSFALAAIGVALLAAAFDGATGTIPNRITLPVLVGAPLVHVVESGPGGLGPSLLGALACCVVPFFLFARGGMGGGDVKLFAALGALVGCDAGLRVEIAALWITLLYAVAKLSYRGALLAMLARSVHTFTRIVAPGRSSPDLRVEDEHATVRLGVPVAMASVLVLGWPEVARWLVL